MQDRERPLRVFISSASGALAPYRQTAVDVCHRLGMLPEFMEDFDPERPPPADVCHRKVDSCDVFVLLLAHRYGSRPAGAALSYTELEYERALARPDMDLLAFVIEGRAPRGSPVTRARRLQAGVVLRAAVLLVLATARRAGTPRMHGHHTTRPTDDGSGDGHGAVRGRDPSPSRETQR